MLYVNLYNHRKRKHLKERELLQKQYEEELIKTQMEVQEHTLKTIAGEIHDNVGQLLSLSKLTLGTVNMRNDPERAEQKIHSTLTLLDASIKELRQLSAVLYAENLLSMGLERAVENELNWLTRSGQFKVEWECIPQTKKEIDQQKALIAFRLIQELLNNTIKHADASAITVLMRSADDDITITVRDNGKGFDIAAALTQRRGLGLTTLFKRAKMINGHLTLTSEAGVGTTATLIFPYR